MDKYKRYLFNIGLDGINEEQQNKIINSKIIIAGVGAIGSMVLANLTALGVENIKIIDNKVLEETDYNCGIIHKYSNIGRARVISAKDWVNEFNPNVKLEIEKTRITDLNYQSSIKGYDMIIDCCEDEVDTYALNQIAVKYEKILIHGQAKGFNGHVTTIIPPQTACLSCMIIKPQSYENKDYNFIAPTTNIIASIQTNEAIKVIIGSPDILANKLLTYNGLRNEFRTMIYSKSLVCDTCSKF